MTKEPANGQLQARVAFNSSAILAEAAKLLADRGVKFTPIRRSVLELLCRNKKAIGAYEIASSFEHEYGRTVVPNTVYRALEFLEEQGLVVHLMSTRAYALNGFQQHAIPNVFFVCMSCKMISEMVDPHLVQAARSGADKIHFNTSTRPIEIQGSCMQCSK